MSEQERDEVEGLPARRFVAARVEPERGPQTPSAETRRYQRLGFAADRFVLRMTREEIGNYLGLTLETVSRLFSRFQRDGLVSVKQRDIALRNIDRLREIV